MGRIQTSSSPYGAQVLFARKKDGTLRMCLDYRQLNQTTIKDRTPLPNIEEMRGHLGKARFFSKMDLRDGYYNILVHPDDRAKTAFRTRFGHFEFTVMPFGLTNAPATFMKMMNRIFADVYDQFVIIYLDDILVFSNTMDDHISHLNTVLTRLRDHTLFAKLSKCSFLADSVDFCGFEVSAKGLQIHPNRITAITSTKPPRNPTEVLAFLGSANFFRDFIPDFSKITQPLTDLLKKGVAWSWTTTEQEAFVTLLTAFTSAPILHHFDSALPTVVTTDASQFAIGGWLGQTHPDNILYPCAYWSRKLSSAERNYPVHERELLALVEFTKRFRHFVAGNPFTARLDHRSIEHIFTQPHLSGRQIRWLNHLQELQPQIEYLPGKTNTLADWLSRMPQHQQLCDHCHHLIAPTPQSVSAITVFDDHLIQRIRTAILTDPFATTLPAFIKDPKSAPKNIRRQLHRWTQDPARPGLWLWDKSKVYVPADDDLRLELLELFHNPLPAGHQGCHRSLLKLNPLFHWPTIESDFKKFVSSCDLCQRTQPRTQAPPGFLHPLPIPNNRFEDLGIDFLSLPSVGPNGYDCVMGIVCRLTKLTRLIPCKSTIDGPTAAQLFLDNWIFTGRSLPKSLTSDRDTLFHSTFFQQICKSLGIKQQFATARHQQTDGQIERTFSTLQNVLKKFTNYHSTAWITQLPSIEFALNNSVNASTGYTPFFLAFGMEPILIPIPTLPTEAPAMDLLTSMNDNLKAAQTNITKAQEQQKAAYDQHHTAPPQYIPGDWVLLQRDGITWPPDKDRPAKLLAPWLGPFRVASLDPALPLNVTLSLPYPLNIHTSFHVSKVKPYIHPNRFFPREDTPTQPGPEAGTPDEYEVETILDCRKDGRRCLPLFLVRWKGYGPTHDTWEPELNLNKAASILRRFKAANRAHPALATPSKR